MNPFLDTGFLLTLLIETDGSTTARSLIRSVESPIPLPRLQSLAIENRLLRAIAEHPGEVSEMSASALAQLRRWQEELVFAEPEPQYDVAFRLAEAWQRQITGSIPPYLVLIWPALSVTQQATHFFSVDPRSRRFAASAGLKLLPEKL